MGRVMFLVVLFFASSRASANEPVASLSFLIGEWTLEGKETTFRERCEWFPGGKHVVCSSTSGERRGVSVFSYSEVEGSLVYYHYGSSGAVVAMRVFSDGRSLVGTAERRGGDVIVREQIWMTPREDGSFDFREEVSKNGGPWAVSVKMRYLRVPGAVK